VRQRTPVIVREARPEEHGRLGELVVTAYRSLPDFDEPDYEPELRDGGDEPLEGRRVRGAPHSP